MSHPAWCVVVEAHSDEDCHRQRKPGETCVALVRDRTHESACGRPAKGWKRMLLPSWAERSRPACGLHLRAYMPAAPR
jgi:hypothetical protein